MSKHTLHCCPICDQPIEITGHYGSKEITYVAKHGIKMEIGSSEGGWGHFRGWIEFSEEVCDDCYTKLDAMLRPAIEFVRGNRRREGDQVSTMRSGEPSSAGRGASLLRLLSPFRTD